MTTRRAVLVTGGAGFIGSHLCEALLLRGYRVVVLDNFCDFYDPAVKEGNVAEMSRAADSSPGELVVLKGDIRRAGDLDRAVLALGDPGRAAVVHLAAMAGVRPSIQNPRLYNEVNVAGTLEVLEACRRNGIGRLAFASSSSVYGNNAKVPFSEADPVDNPISPYAATKRAGELLCHNYHHLYGLSVASLRFFTVYGPRQRPDLAIHKFARLIDGGRPIPFFGDGTTRRDYTFVTDTLQGILGSLEWLAAAEVPVYDVFNLGESQTVELSELVDLLGRALGTAPALERLPMQPGDVLCTYADIEKARRLLKYDPKVSITEGIPRFIEWFRGQKRP